MSKPIVASYCATFLAPEMLHVYRQITGLQEFEQRVITQKWIHRDQFPIPEDRVTVVPRAATRALRRFWFKQVLDGPILITERQRDTILDATQAAGASLLHIYFGHIGVYLLPVLRTKQLPVIVSFHGADAGVDMDKSRHRSAMEEVFTLADRILVRSDSLARQVQELGCPKAKIRLSRTGIPLENWPFQIRQAPSDGKWILLQACRLIEKKGIDLSLRAFAKIREFFPAAKFQLAGEGPLLLPMQELAAELGLADSVEFLGFLNQDDLRRHIEAAHVFLHPSRMGADGNQEGVPNSMLEAMASGLPVVATRHGGIPEVITDNESGLLVDEEDWVALGAQILRLLEDETTFAKIAEQGRQVIESSYSQQAQISQLEGIYREVAQTP